MMEQLRLRSHKHKTICRIPRVLRRQMEVARLSEACIHEVVAIFGTWYQHGVCALSQARFEYWTNSRVREELVDFLKGLEKNGIMRKVGKHSAGVRSIQREFTIRGVTSIPSTYTVCNSSAARSSVSSPSSSSVSSPSSSVTWRTIFLDAAVAQDRSAKWVEYCDVNDLELRLDSHAKTAWGKATHKGLTALRLPDNPTEDLDLSELSEKKMAWLEQYVANRHEGLSPVVVIKRNRLYHGLSNCPRSLRAKAEYWHNQEWQRAVTVDISGAYWCILASKMEECEEKTRLIRLLQSNEFRPILAAECGLPNDQEFKKTIQKQGMFWNTGWHYKDRPVAQALDKLFPTLYAMIVRCRRRWGVTGFSDKLMEQEARIIVHGALIEASEFCPALSLHDALLVPESEAKRVQAIIKKHALRVLGFVPAVKIG